MLASEIFTGMAEAHLSWPGRRDRAIHRLRGKLKGKKEPKPRAANEEEPAMKAKIRIFG
jgi:hypothetical protein